MAEVVSQESCSRLTGEQAADMSTLAVNQLSDMTMQRTIIEAFVKMVVCRKITVQRVAFSDGHILESRTTQEEDSPVILNVTRHETSNLSPRSATTSRQGSADTTYSTTTIDQGYSLSGGNAKTADDNAANVKSADVCKESRKSVVSSAGSSRKVKQGSSAGSDLDESNTVTVSSSLWQESSTSPCHVGDRQMDCDKPNSSDTDGVQMGKERTRIAQSKGKETTEVLEARDSESDEVEMAFDVQAADCVPSALSASEDQSTADETQVEMQSRQKAPFISEKLIIDNDCPDEEQRTVRHQAHVSSIAESNFLNSPSNAKLKDALAADDLAKCKTDVDDTDDGENSVAGDDDGVPGTACLSASKSESVAASPESSQQTSTISNEKLSKKIGHLKGTTDLPELADPETNNLASETATNCADQYTCMPSRNETCHAEQNSGSTASNNLTPSSMPEGKSPQSSQEADRLDPFAHLFESSFPPLDQTHDNIHTGALSPTERPPIISDSSCLSREYIHPSFRCKAIKSSAIREGKIRVKEEPDDDCVITAAFISPAKKPMHNISGPGKRARGISVNLLRNSARNPAWQSQSETHRGAGELSLDHRRGETVFGVDGDASLRKHPAHSNHLPNFLAAVSGSMSGTNATASSDSFTDVPGHVFSAEPFSGEASDLAERVVCGECGRDFTSSNDLFGHLCSSAALPISRPDACNEWVPTSVHSSLTSELETCNAALQQSAVERGQYGRQWQTQPPGSRVHQCPYCPKRFADRTVLKQHVVSHTGHRQFGCHICGKRFKQRAHLNTHLKFHMGVKRYRCEQCGQAYVQKGDLVRHLRSLAHSMNNNRGAVLPSCTAANVDDH